MLHRTAPHCTTLHRTLPPALHFIALHLHCFVLHCAALHCTALHCTAFHRAAPRHTVLHSTHSTALYRTQLFCIALHCTALHCTALHCTTLHHIRLHQIAVHCTARHCFARIAPFEVRAPCTDGKPSPSLQFLASSHDRLVTDRDGAHTYATLSRWQFPSIARRRPEEASTKRTTTQWANGRARGKAHGGRGALERTFRGRGGGPLAFITH